jgi:hypothetical protein
MLTETSTSTIDTENSGYVRVLLVAAGWFLPRHSIPSSSMLRVTGIKVFIPEQEKCHWSGRPTTSIVRGLDR